MIDNKKSIKYPKILAKRYLLDYLEEMGYYSIGGMGDKMQITFYEIDSYTRITRTNLNHWEVLALRTLSLEYIIQLQKKDVMEKPPFLEVSEGDYLRQTSISGNSIAKKFGMVLK